MPKLSREKEEEIIKQLKKNFNHTAIAENVGVHRNTVRNVAKRLEEEKKDIVVTGEVLGSAAKQLGDMKDKYRHDVSKYNKIIHKAVKLTNRTEEIKTMLANGVYGLLEANLNAAAALSTKVTKDIEDGTIDDDQIGKMVLINNNAPKVGLELLEKTKEDVLAEEEKEKMEQSEIDFDGMSQNDASKAYREVIKE